MSMNECLSARSRSALAILLFLLAASALGCTRHVVSEDDTAPLGERLEESLSARELPIVAPDTAVGAWAAQLVAGLDPRGALGVIIDDDAIEAVSLPGGAVFVTTGLVLAAGSCAEVAGAVAHELGHIEAGHDLELLEAQFGAQLIGKLVRGESLPDDVVRTVENFAMRAPHAPNMERDADRIAVHLLFAAGYNPYGLVDFLERMLGRGADTPDSPPTFLMTHPVARERITATADFVVERHGTAVERGTTQSYDCLGTALSLAEVQDLIRSGALERYELARAD